MDNEQAIDRVDAMNAAARRKAQKGPDWHPYFYKRVSGGLIIKGCRAQRKTRGPNKGELRYFTEEDEATVVVTPQDVDLEFRAAKFNLEAGTALVLVGPPGCGKSRLAKLIASSRGTFRHISLEQLESPFCLGAILCEGWGTLILDEFPAYTRTVGLVKDLITCKTVEAKRKFKAPARVEAPNFIICSDNTEQLLLAAADRRFRVVQVG